MLGRYGPQDPAEDCYPYPNRTGGDGMRREGDVQEQSEESELLAQPCERAVVRVGPQQVCPERTRVSLKNWPKCRRKQTGSAKNRCVDTFIYAC